MVETECNSEANFDPIPIKTKEDLLRNLCKTELIKLDNPEPGSLKHNQYMKIMKEIESFVNNFEAPPGYVLLDFDFYGFGRFKVVKV